MQERRRWSVSSREKKVNPPRRRCQKNYQDAKNLPKEKREILSLRWRQGHFFLGKICKLHAGMSTISSPLELVLSIDMFFLSSLLFFPPTVEPQL